MNDRNYAQITNAIFFTVNCIETEKQGFFVTVRAGTVYRHLFSKVKKKNYF